MKKKLEEKQGHFLNLCLKNLTGTKLVYRHIEIYKKLYKFQFHVMSE